MAKRPTTDDAARSAPARPGFKVRATQMGYYGEKRRRTGDVFVLTDAKDFSETWMEKVDPRTPERVTTGNEDIRRKHDEEIAARHTPGLHTGRDDVHDVPTGNANPLGDVD